MKRRSEADTRNRFREVEMIMRRRPEPLHLNKSASEGLVPGEDRQQPIPAHGRSFPTTRWSLVLSAGHPGPGSGEALESLCRIYWPAIYAYARYRGYPMEQAEDLTQGFFTKFLEKNYIEQADRERGKFRTFLLCSFKNYMANEWDRSQAQKRGGGRWPVSLDFNGAEDRVRIEPEDPATPESIFVRRWAHALVDKVMSQLRQEMARDGHAERFDRLAGRLVGFDTDERYGELAGRFDMTENAVRVIVHRMRRRFVHLLRTEVAHTVENPDAVDTELRFLIEALGPPKR